MDLKPKTKVAGHIFQQVRETPEVHKALVEEAARVGISQPEAIRQIISAYLSDPFPFTGKTGGNKSAVWANISAPREMVDAFTHHTQVQGVSVAEGIRQCVRRFLEKKGRAV